MKIAGIIFSSLLFFVGLIPVENCRAQACVSGGIASGPRSYILMNNITITGLRINATTGPCLHLAGCSNVTISNCILGPSPSRDGSSPGAGVYLENCTNVTISNCSFMSNYLGVYAVGGSGIKVNNNQFSNVIGGYPRGQFVQFNTVTGAGNEIRDNVGDNVPGARDPQDLINVFKSSGSATSPILISGNKFRGGCITPFGGGILIGDNGGSYMRVENNTLVNTGHFGIGVAGGNNISVLNNTIYNRMLGCSGIYAWGQSASCSLIDIEGNAVDYNHDYNGSGGAYGYDGRNDNCGTTGLTNNNWDASFGPGVLPDRLLCPLLMGYYRFNATWNDASGNGLTAIPNNGAFAGQGENEMCANFDGTARYLTLPNSPWLEAQSERLTVSCWIKPWTVRGVQGIAQAQNSDGYNSGWRMILNGNTFSARLVTDVGTVDISCGGIVQGNWTHLVMEYDGQYLKAYVNGVLQATAAISGNVLYNGSNAPARIGNCNGTNYLNAFLDEFKFYDGSLSDGEVLQDYNSNYSVVTTPQPEVRAYYSFNRNWTDNSGNGLTAATHGVGFACGGANSISANYNGSSYLTLPSSPLLDPFSSTLTVACWIKPANLTGIKGIAQSQNGDGYSYGWRMLLLDGVLNPRVVTNQGAMDLYCPGIQAGVWNYVVMTYDGLSIKGYVNGVLQGSSAWGGYIPYNVSTLSQMQIGLCNGSNYYYAGYMDEFKLFDGPLSAGQVMQEYNSAYPLINATPDCSLLLALAPVTGSKTAMAIDEGPANGVVAKDSYIITPNPASVELKIRVAGVSASNLARSAVLQGELYNSIGQLVRSGRGNRMELTLNVADLPAGVYFLRIGNGDDRVVRKIIVK